MLASFVSWWLARIQELLPTALTSAITRPRDGLVIETAPDGYITVSFRKRGRLTPTTLGAAARLGGRKPILLHPPAGTVLQKTHVVPTVPSRQMQQMLHHELARITPFAAADLFWDWQARAKASNRARTDVTLTMVPRQSLAAMVTALEDVGLKPAFVEVGPSERPTLLPVDAVAGGTVGTLLNRGLVWGCAALAIVALLLPVALQELAFYETDAAIADLQPTIAQVDALRRRMEAGDAGRDILAQETQRTGDVLQTLAAVTRILPDDTYLTDFALRDRQVTLSGRSASAPRLITGLSADPAIRNAAFAAPVTRIEGATSDLFSIKAEVAR
jgi:general secretion pathway protein L